MDCCLITSSCSDVVLCHAWKRSAAVEVGVLSLLWQHRQKERPDGREIRQARLVAVVQRAVSGGGEHAGK